MMAAAHRAFTAHQAPQAALSNPAVAVPGFAGDHWLELFAERTAVPLPICPEYQLDLSGWLFFA